MPLCPSSASTGTANLSLCALPPIPRFPGLPHGSCILATNVMGIVFVIQYLVANCSSSSCSSVTGHNLRPLGSGNATRNVLNSNGCFEMYALEMAPTDKLVIRLAQCHHMQWPRPGGYPSCSSRKLSQEIVGIGVPLNCCCRSSLHGRKMTRP